MSTTAPPIQNTSRDLLSARRALLAAQISGQLFRASRTARKLVLVAQNSRTMAARIGERALGLDVLSEYFAGLSRDTIRLSEEVSTLATQISGRSVESWRVRQFLNAINRSREIDASLKKGAALAESGNSAKKHADDLEQSIVGQRQILARKLGELESNARSASTLAVNVRLEATKTGEFEAILRNMASDLESLSLNIGERANNSVRLLEEMRSNRANAEAI